MTERHKKIVGWISLGIFVLFSLLIVWFIGRPMVRFVSQPDLFRDWVNAHGIWGRLAFVGMMVLQVVVAVIPGEPLEIGAGYAFGALEGTLLCVLGAVIGSVLVFALVRTWGAKLLEVFFPLERIQSLKFLQNTRRLNLLVFIVFFIPGTPKDLLCYVVGLTKMKLSMWIAITAVARIPSIVTSTMGGDALGMGNYQFAVIVFAVTFLVSGAGVLIYNHICKAHQAKEPPEAQK